MKLGYIFLTMFCIFNSVNILAVSILINTDEQTQKEEKKAEEKVELPSPAKLAINVINMTGYKYVATIIASVKKNDYGFVMAQSNIDPQGKITMATLLAPSNSSFIFNEAEVIMLKDEANMDIKCNLAPKDAAKDEELAANKAIDMYLYLPAEQDLPHCVIKYDSI